MDIEALIKDGFVLSPYYSKNSVDLFSNIRKIELSEKEIRTIIVGTSYQRYELLFDDNSLILVKYLTKYHVKPIDLIERFTNELESEDGPYYDDLISWSHFSALEDNDGYVFTPHLDEKYFKNDNDGVDDYLFEKDDHIVAYLTRLIREELREDRLEDDLKRYINFIKEILSQRNVPSDKRIYSTDTISLMLDSLTYETYRGKNLDINASQFYKKNLLEKANEEDPYLMMTLGYEYYEGSNGFPCDPFLACYWLEKYYKVSEDPDVARTLGYIYYYGRTTDGVPQGDKAFQYFAIGHIAGTSYESTYKLADCYVKGYGTPINHQCAYILVSDIYEPSLECFLNGNDSKFADIALRIGSYYRDGIYVPMNLKKAYSFFLQAKVAIKKRLENMEYIGDRGVAIGISKSIEDIQNIVGIKKRIVKKIGYLINDIGVNYANVDCKAELIDEYIRLVICQSKKIHRKYVINEIQEIGFAERSKKTEFYLKLQDVQLDDFIREVNSLKVLEIYISEDFISFNLEDKNREITSLFAKCDEVIYVPQTIKDFSKRYTVVSIEFYAGSKLYDYLCLKEDVKIGDEVEIESNGKTKSVTVKKVKSVYEDELPLPYKKMAKAK